jgi:hypothetical protein
MTEYEYIEEALTTETCGWSLDEVTANCNREIIFIYSTHILLVFLNHLLFKLGIYSYVLAKV